MFQPPWVPVGRQPLKYLMVARRSERNPTAQISAPAPYGGGAALDSVPVYVEETSIVYSIIAGLGLRNIFVYT